MGLVIEKNAKCFCKYYIASSKEAIIRYKPHLKNSLELFD